ncbi:MAG: VWA domain-containing protein [Elusimicrobiota bacterium]
MIFSRPWALWLLPALLLPAALFVAGFRRKSRLLSALGDAPVLRKLWDPAAERHQRVKAVLALLACLFLFLALAGPRWGLKFQEARRRGGDVMRAVDTSASMLAEDVKPNRLVQAKRELGLLIGGLEGDRVGVVAFAGTAFLQCPLTLDYGAARMLLDLITTDLIPAPGTSLAAALDAAREAFVREERKHKALVLLTDGEDHSGRLEAAVERAREEGVRVFAIGFGSPQGEIIPVRDEQGGLSAYKKDKAGQTVVSKLNEEALRDMAAKTGGRYYRATDGEVEVERILADLRGMEKKSLQSKVFDQHEDRFAWPLAAALALLLLEFLWPETPGHFGRLLRRARETAPRLFRRSAAAGILLLAAPRAEALGRAPGESVAEFNRGVKQYKKGDYSAAARSFQAARPGFADAERAARSAYNAGNASFRQERFSDAVEHYKQALRLNPADADAKHNLELARKMTQAQKSQPKPDEKNKGGSKDQEPSGGGEDGRGKKDPAAAGARPGALSKEDAERLLQAVEAQEKEARQKMRAPASKKDVEKDW